MLREQCNGGSNSLAWSTSDAQGASSLYGAPGSGGGGGTGGTPEHETKTGSAAQGQSQQVGALTVKPGTTFTVVMDGTGDPDLYVRWDADPTTTTYNCRPYLGGATEQCALTVPAASTSANIMVRGYTAATYSLDITYTAP